MDRILVTLLIVLVSVVALFGVIQWSSTQDDNLKADASTSVSSTLNKIK
ncbi:hypothetical protein [Halarcobacter sp.]|nr:hypothetical protein [Halarcobacter sp.]